MIITHLTKRNGAALRILLIGATVLSIGFSSLEFLNVIHASQEASSMNAEAQAETPWLPLPDMQLVAHMNWFGVSPEELPAAGRAPSQFELRGISKSQQSTLAGAFISENGGTEIYYRIGDSLPGNGGVLSAVAEDHVLIKNNTSITELGFRPEAPSGLPAGVMLRPISQAPPLTQPSPLTKK